MDILVNNENVVVSSGTDIQFVEFEGEQKWKLAEHRFLVDYNFTLIKGVTLPLDYSDNKYKYIDDTFTPNSDYVEYKTPEQELSELKQIVTSLQTTNETLTACLLEMSEIVYA